MRNWLNRVMAGRYGADQLGRALSVVCCVLALVALIGSKTFLAFLWYPALALMIYNYFRMFSRNFYKRQAENQWYLEHTEGLRRKFHLMRDQFQQRRDYKFFSCPNCKTTVRVPKGKGTLNITCPRCREKFTRKS
jgi:hypothetical protein